MKTQCKKLVSGQIGYLICSRAIPLLEYDSFIDFGVKCQGHQQFFS